MKIPKVFRETLSEKLMDLGNLTAGALILGQFISGKEFSLTLLITGIVGLLLLYITSLVVIKERR